MHGHILDFYLIFPHPCTCTEKERERETERTEFELREEMNKAKRSERGDFTKSQTLEQPCSNQ